MAIPNVNPEDAVNYVINFRTINSNSGAEFDEPHRISGPEPGGNFNKSFNVVDINENKSVIQLSESSQEGSYWLKIHKPQPNSSSMYVTFAVKNSKMQDGFYDYKTGIPPAFRTEFRDWIKDERTVASFRDTKEKNIIFYMYGIDTNKTSSAIQFKVRFRANFTGDIDGEIGVVSVGDGDGRLIPG